MEQEKGKTDKEKRRKRASQQGSEHEDVKSNEVGGKKEGKA